MPLTNEQIMEALRGVQDPEIHKDLVTLNMVKNIDVSGAAVSVVIELTTPACPLKDQIRSEVEQAIRMCAAEALEVVELVNIEFTADVRSPQQKLQDNGSLLPNVRNVIAIGAGKGGVGKSTVSVNVAVSLARQGARVGIIDGDVYGPSLPTMLGLDAEQATMANDMIQPFEIHGVKAMTIGALVPPEKPLIWRGPMAHGAFKQLITQTEWGELDYLIVDLPPGTGDVPLSLMQMLPLAGAVIVSTPQKVAQDDARRAAGMFSQMGVAVLGVVENMSYFVCEHGTDYDIFGRGGAEMMAQELGVPFLGALPITPELRENCDTGNPTANFENPGPLQLSLESIAQNLAAQISIAALRQDSVQPTMSIS